MFLSESIRCFQNHFTNMMVLDLADAHVINKGMFCSPNINPMARGKTWPHKQATGMELLGRLLKSEVKFEKRAGKGISERLSRITINNRVIRPILRRQVSGNWSILRVL